MQKYDKQWDCWLFPYVKSTDINKANVDDFVSDLIKKEISTKYVAQTTHCKYSVSDNTYKIYNHKVYEVLLAIVPEHMLKDSFIIDGTEYKWMSIEQMENDEGIMEK